MISEKLNQKFKILEMAMFSEWQKASKKERKKMITTLGKLEAKMIIKEIKLKE